MREVAKFFEDFEIGETRTTDARTITETDIVIHAMHSGDFMPHPIAHHVLFVKKRNR